jgi:hypothetical protein
MFRIAVRAYADQRQGRTVHPVVAARVGIRLDVPELGPPNCCLGKLAASKIRLEPSSQRHWRCRALVQTQLGNKQRLDASQLDHYRTLLIQARGALKRELLRHLRRIRGMRQSRHHMQKTDRAQRNSRNAAVGGLAFQDHRDRGHDRPQTTGKPEPYIQLALRASAYGWMYPENTEPLPSPARSSTTTGTVRTPASAVPPPRSDPTRQATTS